METKILVRGLAALSLVGGLLPGGTAAAEDLPLEQYFDLSIARLELSKAAWSTTQAPPTAEAMAGLFTEHGIDEADYLAYTSEHREAIDAYLAAHPDDAQRIEALSTDIEQAIGE